MSTSSRGHKYVSYLGVPYAVPPVGNLRFSRPVPLTPGFLWNGTFDATQTPPICLQLEADGIHSRGQEDCLVVNIYKPGKFLKAVPQELPDSMEVQPPHQSTYHYLTNNYYKRNVCQRTILALFYMILEFSR